MTHQDQDTATNERGGRWEHLDGERVRFAARPPAVTQEQFAKAQAYRRERIAVLLAPDEAKEISVPPEIAGWLERRNERLQGGGPCCE